MVFFQNADAKALYDQFRPLGLVQYQDFTQSEVKLSLLDLLNAVIFACNKRWFNVETFDIRDYQQMRLYTSGDLNWIIPGEVLALSTPSDEVIGNLDMNSGQKIAQIVSSLGVKTIVRLNKPLYDPRSFSNLGVRHHDFYYPDGTVPSKDIFMKCLKVLRVCATPFAVHCKAGIGRTGTMIGAYLITKYRMPSKLAIAWMRICRSGMVNSTQQDFLKDLGLSNLGPSKLDDKSLKLSEKVKPKSCLAHLPSPHDKGRDNYHKKGKASIDQIYKMSRDPRSWEMGRTKSERKFKGGFQKNEASEVASKYRNNSSKNIDNVRFDQRRSNLGFNSGLIRNYTDEGEMNIPYEGVMESREQKGSGSIGKKQRKKNPLNFTLKKYSKEERRKKKFTPRGTQQRAPRLNGSFRLSRTATSASRERLRLNKLEKVMNPKQKQGRKGRKAKRNPLKKFKKLNDRRKKIESLISNRLSKPIKLRANMVAVEHQLSQRKNSQELGYSVKAPYGLKNSYRDVQHRGEGLAFNGNQTAGKIFDNRSASRGKSNDRPSTLKNFFNTHDNKLREGRDVRTQSSKKSFISLKPRARIGPIRQFMLQEEESVEKVQRRVTVRGYKPKEEQDSNLPRSKLSMNFRSFIGSNNRNEVLGTGNQSFVGAKQNIRGYRPNANSNRGDNRVKKLKFF